MIFFREIKINNRLTKEQNELYDKLSSWMSNYEEYKKKEELNLKRNDKEKNIYSNIYDSLTNANQTINSNSNIKNSIINYRINSVTFKVTKKNNDSKSNNISELCTFNN